MLRNISLSDEQHWIEQLHQERPKKAKHDPMKNALQSWQSMSRRSRSLIKAADPTYVLELELKLMHFKSSPDGEVTPHRDGWSHFWQLGLRNQSRYLVIVCEGLCCFHRLSLRAEEAVDKNDAGHRLWDVRIRKLERWTEGIRADGDVEVTCTDVAMAVQELKPVSLNAHRLKRFVMTQIHGTEDS